VTTQKVSLEIVPAAQDSQAALDSQAPLDTRHIAQELPPHALANSLVTEGKRLILRGDVGISDARMIHAGALELSLTSGSAQLDLTDVGQMDVSVLQVLAGLDAQLRQAGRELQVTGVSDAIREQWKAVGWSGLE
jgi:anti-anti-sigma regulatory factor